MDSGCLVDSPSGPDSSIPDLPIRSKIVPSLPVQSLPSQSPPVPVPFLPRLSVQRSRSLAINAYGPVS